MSGDPSQSTPASETHTEQASQLLHGHVNSIKSKLGLEDPNSPLGRLAAHTKRKMAELEAARAAGIKAAPGSPDWQAAMKPDSFGKGFIKANKTQFLITSGVFSLGLFWLLVIRFVHHDANVNQTGNSEAAQRALANQHMAGMPAPQAFQAPQTTGVPGGLPAGFGVPNSGFGMPNAGGSYPQAQSAPTGPAFLQPAQLPTAQPIQINPSAAQMYAPTAPQIYAPPAAQVYSPYTQQTPGYGLQSPATISTPQHNLYPVRQHTTARHQVVVNR